MPARRLPLSLIAAWLACAPALAAAPLPAAGAWHGSIGKHPIIFCSGSDQRLSYRYQDRPAAIQLVRQDGQWSESADGEPTGSWRITGNQADTLSGQWTDAKGKKRLPIALRRVAADKTSCRGPNDPAGPLKLAPPRFAQVAASAQGAVLRPDGALWAWSDLTRNVPLRVGDGFVQLALGDAHAAAIKADGTLWAWGSNHRGQLGDIPASDVPVQIGRGFRHVAADDSHTYGIQGDGTLWAWGGKNIPGKFSQEDEPTPPPAMLGSAYVSVSARNGRVAALKADGTLWMWDGDFLQAPVLSGQDFVQVSVGYGHTAAVKQDGSLWTWGSNSWGQLGDGTETERTAPVKIGDGYLQASAGYLGTAAVKRDGSLWAWGSNENGIFGDCTTASHSSPVQIDSDVVHVAAGQHFLLASRRDGSLWTWGWHWDGDQTDTPRACRKAARVVLGNGLNKWDQDVAAALAVAPGPAGSIAASGSHTALVKADGTLWTWGSNAKGQLADGTFLSRNTPALVGSGYLHAGAERHSLTVLKNDGSLWRWGDVRPAQTPLKVSQGMAQVMRSGYQNGRTLGLHADGTLWDWAYHWDMHKPPVKIGHQVRAIAAGGYASYALRTDGSLWELKSYPVEVPRQVGRDFVRIVSATDRAYGIKADGSLWAWGDNAYHQLGDGTSLGKGDPVRIGGGFAEVAAGRLHGVALKRDGSLWAWGHNEAGAVGDGSTADRAAPVRIGSGFVRIAAGDYHSVAMKRDGTVWAWGNNEDGQLGDGTHVRRLAPVPVDTTGAKPRPAAAPPEPRSGAVRSILVGQYFGCALLGNGQVRCWGSNAEGQLGNERREQANPAPLAVTGVEQAVALQAMRGMVCAALKNGHAVCWGPGVMRGNPIPGSSAVDVGDIGGQLHTMLDARADPADACRVSRSGKASGHCSSVCAGRKKAPLSACDRIIARFPSLAGATHIESDPERACGLMPNGKVQCIASGKEDGTVIDGVHDAVALATWDGNGCALQRDGRVKCWGSNEHGQLGDGKQSLAYRPHPVAVQVTGLGN